MKRFLLALGLLFAIASSASAQNPTCPTRLSGDSTNACASTAFVQSNTGSGLNAASFGVKCDGVTDDSNAMQNAINASAGRTLYVNAGTCLITSQLVYQLANGQTFQPGFTLKGAGGWGVTTFDTRVANDCLFLIQGTADNFFTAGVTISDITITSLASSANACGMEAYRAAFYKLENVWFHNLPGDGFLLPASLGDADASFVILFDRVRFDNVATSAGHWCANFLAPSAGWAVSNLRMTNSNFSGCGHAGDVVIPPVSGAVRGKILTMQLENTTFTLNNNSSLYFQGADTSSTITIDGGDFENTISTVLPHVYVDGGLRNFKLTNSECLSNDLNIVTGCVWINTSSGTASGVTIDGVKVRATAANNPYTAFQITGGNGATNTITVNNIWWLDFDHTGQTRFSGITFTPIPGQAFFSISVMNVARLIPVGYGGCIPIKMSATGEWICYQVPTTGVTGAAAVATPATVYNFYAFNTAATGLPPVIGLERAITGTALDTSGGYFVKSGDSTRTFIGTATTDGGGNFQTTGVQSSWYPPTAPNFTANGSVATTVTSLGPTGSHTTIQEWLVIQNSAGVIRYIPAY